MWYLLRPWRTLMPCILGWWTPSKTGRETGSGKPIDEENRTPFESREIQCGIHWCKGTGLHKRIDWCIISRSAWGCSYVSKLFKQYCLWYIAVCLGSLHHLSSVGHVHRDRCINVQTLFRKLLKKGCFSFLLKFEGLCSCWFCWTRKALAGLNLVWAST